MGQKYGLGFKVRVEIGFRVDKRSGVSSRRLLGMTLSVTFMLRTKTQINVSTNTVPTSNYLGYPAI